jgi:hypothetical protein
LRWLIGWLGIIPAAEFVAAPVVHLDRGGAGCIGRQVRANAVIRLRQMIASQPALAGGLRRTQLHRSEHEKREGEPGDGMDH